MGNGSNKPKVTHIKVQSVSKAVAFDVSFNDNDEYLARKHQRKLQRLESANRKRAAEMLERELQQEIPPKKQRENENQQKELEKLQNASRKQNTFRKQSYDYENIEKAKGNKKEIKERMNSAERNRQNQVQTVGLRQRGKEDKGKFNRDKFHENPTRRNGNDFDGGGDYHFDAVEADSFNGVSVSSNVYSQLKNILQIRT